MWLHSTTVKHKLPLTYPQLQLVLDKFTFPTSHNDLLVAMILTRFYGLLCLAEISIPNSKELQDWRKLTRQVSVKIHDDSYSFQLLAHKADTSFKGNRIIIKCQDTVDPHALFATYIMSRDKLFPIHLLLWVQENGDCPEPQSLILAIKLWSQPQKPNTFSVELATSLASSRNQCYMAARL